MAGLIQAAMPEIEEKDIPGAGKVSAATPVGYEPETRAVDPAKETVSGQLDTLLKTDSPYLTRARAGAAQAANARGLLNSTMAAGAGEAAAIDAALPIATADASIYGTTSRENTAAKNAALAGTADAANKSALVAAEAGNAKALQTLRGDQAKSLANIEANYRQLIQASSSASGFYDSIAKSMTAIMADTSTSDAQKTEAVGKLNQMLESGLTVIGSIANVDIAGLLDFS